MRRPVLRSTIPFTPKSEHGCPFLASRAMSCDCAVAAKIRRRHGVSIGAASSSQVDTPRFAKSLYGMLRAICGSNTHRSWPVAASSAMTRPRGVPTYMVPSTTMGVASKDGALIVAKRASVSPVR